MFYDGSHSFIHSFIPLLIHSYIQQTLSKSLWGFKGKQDEVSLLKTYAIGWRRHTGTQMTIMQLLAQGKEIALHQQFLKVI